VITFEKTKMIGSSTALVFSNEHGTCVELVFDDKTTRFILQNFERLSPNIPKAVEDDSQ
jgi:hypothetical protein